VYNDKFIYEESDKVPTILDIGCGYGNLLFELSRKFPENLVLGMEIRDKVTNFVAHKINSKRINAGYKQYMNTAVVMTNTMKTFHNYFKKDQVTDIYYKHYLSIVYLDIVRKDFHLLC
jgi:tRNA (guanine-N7-)-methyltransferase